MGIILPYMGTIDSPSLAGALFTDVQQSVLALLFGQPDRRFQSAELIRLAASGTGAVHRQLQRLASSGLVTVTRAGNQKYYQANHDSPIFPELHGLIVKTVGMVVPLREALLPLSDQIVAAWVFGSVARKEETARSDIDLLVLSDSVSHPDLFEALERAERVLDRHINPVLMTRREWRSKRSIAGSFACRVAAGEKLFLLGNENDLG